MRKDVICRVDNTNTSKAQTFTLQSRLRFLVKKENNSLTVPYLFVRLVDVCVLVTRREKY